MTVKPIPPASSKKKEEVLRSGTGALCAEAQADGVPCTVLGKDCEACERADVPQQHPPAESNPDA